MTVLIVIFLIICAIAIFWGILDEHRAVAEALPKSQEAVHKCFRYTEDGVRYIAYEGSEMYDLILKALNRRGR